MKNSASTKSFARSDFAVALAVLGFTFALLCSKWAGAADTRTTYTKNADGSVTTCTYQKDFVQTQDGSHMVRNAWRCETSKK